MPPCSIAAKLRFMSLEAGTKDIKIQFIDADGKEVFPTVQASLEVTASPNGTSAAAVLVVRIQQLKLASAGEYSIGLAVDGRLERTIPLYVQKLETKGQQGKSR